MAPRHPSRTKRAENRILEYLKAVYYPLIRNLISKQEYLGRAYGEISITGLETIGKWNLKVNYQPINRTCSLSYMVNNLQIWISHLRKFSKMIMSLVWN